MTCAKQAGALEKAFFERQVHARKTKIPIDETCRWLGVCFQEMMLFSGGRDCFTGRSVAF